MCAPLVVYGGMRLSAGHRMAVAERGPQVGDAEPEQLLARVENDADVSSIPAIIPYGGFSPVRLDGWPFRRGLPGPFAPWRGES